MRDAVPSFLDISSSSFPQLIKYIGNFTFTCNFRSFILAYLLLFLVKRFPFIRLQSSSSRPDELSDTNTFPSQRR
jgi:hypothetical protein